MELAINLLERVVCVPIWRISNLTRQPDYAAGYIDPSIPYLEIARGISGVVIPYITFGTNIPPSNWQGIEDGEIGLNLALYCTRLESSGPRGF